MKELQYENSTAKEFFLFLVQVKNQQALKMIYLVASSNSQNPLLKHPFWTFRSGFTTSITS